MPSSKQQFMLMACEEASKSMLREKHGCVIVRGGEVVSRGHNKHVVQFTKGLVSCHAERDAILRCRKKGHLRDADLYVVRWGKNVPGNPEIMYSAPCAACVALIRACMKKYGLRNAYYSVDSKVRVQIAAEGNNSYKH
uniref:CMP/dCMP-type deaminase domain-containing protein n=1 Tax=Lotharella globosa TaxID=91324 RepID=A0A7S3ZAY2_9EUKA